MCPWDWKPISGFPARYSMRQTPLPNLCGRLHRLHGNFTLPPFAPDARLKYHCALYGSSQNRVASPIFASGGSRSPEMQGHGAPLRELAAQGMCTGFGYSIVKVLWLILASLFGLLCSVFRQQKKPPTKGSTKHGRRIPLVGSQTTLRDCGVAPILSNRIVLNLM